MWSAKAFLVLENIATLPIGQFSFFSANIEGCHVEDTNLNVPPVKVTVERPVYAPVRRLLFPLKTLSIFNLVRRKNY